MTCRRALGLGFGGMGRQDLGRWAAGAATWTFPEEEAPSPLGWPSTRLGLPRSPGDERPESLACPPVVPGLFGTNSIFVDFCSMKLRTRSSSYESSTHFNSLQYPFWRRFGIRTHFLRHLFFL